MEVIALAAAPIVASMAVSRCGTNNAFAEAVSLTEPLLSWIVCWVDKADRGLIIGCLRAIPSPSELKES
jgi:hypothetical protein